MRQVNLFLFHLLFLHLHLGLALILPIVWFILRHGHELLLEQVALSQLLRRVYTVLGPGVRLTSLKSVIIRIVKVEVTPCPSVFLTHDLTQLLISLELLFHGPDVVHARIKLLIGGTSQLGLDQHVLRNQIWMLQVYLVKDSGILWK